tara:strand:+ start:231 stop:1550 length:1320 start_codon:yes stop_codon:yes gene_type:complete
MKLKSKTYYLRHENEILRYADSRKSWIHIINKNNNYINLTNYPNNFIEINNNVDFEHDFSEIENKLFDFIVITDILELTEDIYKFLKKLNCLLKDDGKLLITTVNPKWNLIMLLLEFFKLKKPSPPRSYLQNKKIDSIAKSSGFEVVLNYGRQVFPFKLFGLGSFINLILEILFLRFNLGINNYLILNKNSKRDTDFSKTIIIPAKNEELNLVPLFNRIPKFKSEYEIIFICGESKDNTLDVAFNIQKNNPDINIKVMKQVSKGKGPGVLEAFKETSNDLIAILDSDISVEPETLIDFFEIVESRNADFVNGTRFVYKMEEGAMRKLNNLGNIFFQFIISVVISNKLTDSLCGTKVFKRELIENLYKWKKLLKINDPFGDFDLIFSAAYSGNKIVEYPVHYKSRVYGSTQISRFRDGFKLLIYFINSILVFKTTNNEIN